MTTPNEAYIVAVQEDGGWRGYLFRNHPTPSGCDRWLLAVSTNRQFELRREAEMALSGSFNDVPVYDPEFQSYWGGRTSEDSNAR
jgi:hypothetical protein